MGTYSKLTPKGTRDILFEECAAQREARRRLSQVFSLRGYHEVLTPGLEFFDVFNLPGAAIPQQEMYKCTDNQGRLLVLRPDSTLPIARMAASRLQQRQKPLRFYYGQTVYRNSPDLSGRNDECAQMGIELMGAQGLRADLEVIAAGVEALSTCVENFRVEIGHAGFFRALADQLPLSPGERETLCYTAAFFERREEHEETHTEHPDRFGPGLWAVQPAGWADARGKSGICGRYRRFRRRPLDPVR